MLIGPVFIGGGFGGLLALLLVSVGGNGARDYKLLLWGAASVCIAILFLLLVGKSVLGKWQLVMRGRALKYEIISVDRDVSIDYALGRRAVQVLCRCMETSGEPEYVEVFIREDKAELLSAGERLLFLRWDQMLSLYQSKYKCLLADHMDEDMRRFVSAAANAKIESYVSIVRPKTQGALQ